MFHRPIEIRHNLHPLACDCADCEPDVPSRPRFAPAVCDVSLKLLAGLALGEAVVLILDAVRIG